MLPDEYKSPLKYTFGDVIVTCKGAEINKLLSVRILNSPSSYIRLKKFPQEMPAPLFVNEILLLFMVNKAPGELVIYALFVTQSSEQSLALFE